MSEVALTQYLLFGAMLFVIGLYGALTRRNAVIVLLSIELMLMSANINLLAFGRYGGAVQMQNPDATLAHYVFAQSQMFALFNIAVAAAEVAVGLAILIAIYRLKETANVDAYDTLRR
ncbi:MAG: NADH-quinone oxidoreductase subunit NuoK [Candidatus Carbobacillus altaicus]|nr:NADH-quinone oxidoreductase subunit NuoK [Candidatus Carbobacillus altaicus]